MAQMVALRYGTIPIVRSTGGLKDSIQDLGGNDGNGFTFQSYNAHDMLGAVKRALIYMEKKRHGRRLSFMQWNVILAGRSLQVNILLCITKY